MTPSIPYVDLAGLHKPLRDELLAAAAQVIDHGQFILGPEVEELEHALAERLGVPEVVGVSSGTDALVLALRLAGVGAGDEVITVSHSFVATASAVSLLGARPVFVDIEEETMLMDPAALDAARTERTRAVIPVHLNGFACDLEPIAAFCRRTGLALVEDCAQAFGVHHRARPVGSSGFGCFSLHPLKTLSACGDAGFLALNDGNGAETVRQWRSIGLRDRDHCRWTAGNNRLDTLQAALTLVKLRHFDDWVERRCCQAAAYREALAGRVRLPPRERDGDRVIYSAFVIRHPRRDLLQEALQNRGIDVRPHYPLAIHQQEAWRDLPAADLPVTERVVGEILSLPVGPELGMAACEQVAAAVLEALDEVDGR